MQSRCGTLHRLQNKRLRHSPCKTNNDVYCLFRAKLPSRHMSLLCPLHFCSSAWLEQFKQLVKQDALELIKVAVHVMEAGHSALD